MTSMRYAHLADDPVRAAAEQVSDALSMAMSPSPTDGKAKLRVVK
ncbi:hypothetical protein [Rhodospira trueperi]|nr:hypothetical protein [Rhodospira trueperi]